MSNIVNTSKKYKTKYSTAETETSAGLPESTHPRTGGTVGDAGWRDIQEGTLHIRMDR